MGDIKSHHKQADFAVYRTKTRISIARLGQILPNDLVVNT